MAKKSPAKPVTKKICPKCGMKIAMDAKKCPKCGMDMGKEYKK